MKETTKRLFALMLALTMVCGLLPLNAWATEQSSKTEGTYIQGSSEVHINPLYADVAAEEDPVQPAQSGVQLLSDTTKFTVEAAAEELRDAMEARQGTVTFSYETASFDKNALWADMGEAFEAALAHTGVPTEGDYLRWQYNTWKTGYSGITYTDGSAELDVTYTITYYTTAAQEAAVTTQVNALLSELDVSSMTDDYDKLKAVYDWMCANIAYDYTNLGNDTYTLKYSAYAALSNRTAVCQGYANLLYRLALEMGIDCRLIAGTGNGGAHAWNIVKLGNRYYNVDATWDRSYYEAGLEYGYFLRSGDNFADHTSSAEYLTDEFTAAYPISTTDYDPSADTGGSGEISGTWGDNLTWVLSEDGTLTISGEGAMANPEDYHDELGWYFPWKDYYDQITAVVIAEGVTTVAEGAFSDCPAKEVSLPETLTKIGTGAFADSAMTSIEIPDSVTYFGMSAFYGCEALTSVKLPAGLEFAGEGVFGYCTSLSTVVMPEMPNYDIESHSSLSLYALFEGCSALTDIDFVTFPAITEFMFAWCDGLEEITIPSSAESIWMYAFRECEKLHTVTIPATVKELRPLIFQDCTELRTIYFEGDAPAYDAETYSYYDGPLDTVVATAYYPADNATWTEAVMASYGGNITWVPYTPIEEVPGDLNGDGVVTDADVAQLLWCILFPDDYVIQGDADMNGDGYENTEDVTYLLWHTLFPERYPLAAS